MIVSCSRCYRGSSCRCSRSGSNMTMSMLMIVMMMVKRTSSISHTGSSTSICSRCNSSTSDSIISNVISGVSV